GKVDSFTRKIKPILVSLEHSRFRLQKLHQRVTFVVHAQRLESFFVLASAPPVNCPAKCLRHDLRAKTKSQHSPASLLSLLDPGFFQLPPLRRAVTAQQD